MSLGEPKVRTKNRVLRLPAVLEMTSLSESELERRIQRGEFPKPIRLSDSGRLKGWVEAELEEWLAKRIAAREAGGSDYPSRDAETERLEQARAVRAKQLQRERAR